MINDDIFLEKLFLLSSPAKRASLRRVFNNDPSRVRGLGILASLYVSNLNNEKSLPYKTVGFLFGHLKQKVVGESLPNMGKTLKRASLKKGPFKEGSNPFDRRFDRIVSCTSLETLVLNHIIRLPGFIKDEPINFKKLLLDLKLWNKGRSANYWIEGYYSWNKEETENDNI